MKVAYKNVGRTTKSFHRVIFHPGESAVVDNFINDADMIRIAVDMASTAKKPASKQISKNVKDVEKETTIIKEEQPDGTDKH